MGFTCAKCDCFAVSLRFGKCDENWETNTERLLVTDLASFANFDKPVKKKDIYFHSGKIASVFLCCYCLYNLYLVHNCCISSVPL